MGGLFSGITAKGIGKYFANTLLPDGPTDRLTFRRFKGDKLIAAIRDNGSISQSDVITVALKVNPQELSINEAKLTNKVPTNAPERFVIFDWGNDLTAMTIQGVTGQLLPSSITNRFDASLGTVNDWMDSVSKETNNDYVGKATNNIATASLTKWMSALGYFQLIEMSPKYRTFRRLYEQVYKPFDADKDILTLEMGDYVYRCYFTDFSFTISNASPWNWAYNMSLGIISDLSEKENRNDGAFTSSAKVVAWE